MSGSTVFALWMVMVAPQTIHTEYYPAYREARDAKKMLLIDFGTKFDFSTVDPKSLEGYVICRVPLDYKIDVKGKKERLIDAPAFRCLQNQTGIAVVDLKDKERFRETVSVLPQNYVARDYVATMLNLPAGGSITQRTLAWAFRINQAAGCFGSTDPSLLAHAANHSNTQAAYNSMHHASGFPGSFEIVAASGVGAHDVVSAALDLVNIWRGSPPHWGAATTGWSFYGVDMHTNGSAWYGTGVFR